MVPDSFEETVPNTGELNKARVKLAERDQTIRIGFGNRESAGDKDRRRSVVP